MRKGWRWPLAGFVAGGLIGMTILTANNVGALSRGAGGRSKATPAAGLRDVLHSPPLLVSQGEPLKLTYDVVCQVDDFGKPCALTGRVYVRTPGADAFKEIELAPEGQTLLSATLPAAYARGAGFEYYAVIEDGQGESTTLPAGGASAPQQAWNVASWSTVDLGTHRFGSTRPPDSIRVTAPWGSDDQSLGLDDGSEQARIGPSSFDLAPDGSVVVLDQVNRRLALYGASDGRPARRVPIPFSGGDGDLAVAADGTTYVLDQSGAQSKTPLVRAFNPAGELLATTAVPGRSADMIRVGPSGPVVHGFPSEMWLPTGAGRSALAPGQQVARARGGRPVAGGLEVVVRASPTEARFALVNGARVVKAWRVTSSTNLGEVQLAEPRGDGLLVVLRLWTERQAEFEVLDLSRAGVRERFAIEPAEWAQSAALSQFRVSGDVLYQLRTTPARIDIVKFRMEGSR